MVKLSIVIPVYNMEKYINRCLDSIVVGNGENLENVEVIVVNDGSTDASKELIEAYHWNNIQHIFIDKPNGGLSDARNYGFKKVTGEYVWFVDSDDWIVGNCIRKILPMLDGVDALHFPSYILQYDDFSKIADCGAKGNTGRDLTQGTYQFPVQFSIYRTDFLRENNLKFQFGILMEDLHFSPRALYKAKTVKVVDMPVYHYFQRDGSIMKSKVTEKRINDRIWISHDLFDFMCENVMFDDRKAWSECIVTDVNAIMFDALRSGDASLKEKAKKYIDKEKKLTSLLKNSSNFNNRIWYWLSKSLMGKFYMVYSLLYKLRY